jgi:single-strand DNA-binding protein
MNEPTITITGNLTADPELRYTPTGQAVATLRIASTPRRRDNNGQWTDGNTTFLDAESWGTAAENAAESLAKGDRVLIAGRHRTDVYTPDRPQRRQRSPPAAGRHRRGRRLAAPRGRPTVPRAAQQPRRGRRGVLTPNTGHRARRPTRPGPGALTMFGETDAACSFRCSGRCTGGEVTHSRSAARERAGRGIFMRLSGTRCSCCGASARGGSGGDRLRSCTCRAFDVPLEYGHRPCLHYPDDRGIGVEASEPSGADGFVAADDQTCAAARQLAQPEAP